jgi:arginase
MTATIDSVRSGGALMSDAVDGCRRSVKVIGVACGSGAQDHGCADAPRVLHRSGILRDLENRCGALNWDRSIRPAAGPADALAQVADVAETLAGRVVRTLAGGEFPLVIGGDHSCAIGTWSGVRAAMEEEERLGLIWMDAHMDSHTFRTTPSKALHGMPLACLLGYGHRRLTGIMASGAKLRPQDVCLIGVRSFESGEAALLQNLGVRVYFMPEVTARGMPNVFREALARVTENTDAYGISLDLDVLDPEEEPGVGSPVPAGVHKAELLDALRSVHGDARLAALEIVEYNPHRDRGFATAAAIHDLCESVVA